MTISKQTRYIFSGSLKLAVYEWGNASAAQETVVLIHGYPDSAEVWDLVAEKLSARFHVVTYDVRGTGLSDVPASTKDYDCEFLVGDLKQVIATVSPKRPVHVVAYDWGALQGWEAVLGDRLKPQILSYTALAPSLDSVGWWFRRELLKNNMQSYFKVAQRMITSSYWMFFQLPVIPELVWNAGLYRVWPTYVSYLQKTKVPSSNTMLKDSTHAIGMYRANMFKHFLWPSAHKTSIPVNMVILTDDPFVPREISESMREWVENIVYSEIATSHWGMLSHPQQIADNINQFIDSQTAAAKAIAS